MTRSLQALHRRTRGISIVSLVAASSCFSRAIRRSLSNRRAIAAVTQRDRLGIAFWVVVTLFASALPVRMPRGSSSQSPSHRSSQRPILGGPAVGAWVALLGTTEVREMRGGSPGTARWRITLAWCSRRRRGLRPRDARASEHGLAGYSSWSVSMLGGGCLLRAQPDSLSQRCSPSAPANLRVGSCSATPRTSPQVCSLLRRSGG